MTKKSDATNRSAAAISLCMIVRDEAASIEACLRAARPYVDEMIVVDTGSTDDTRERAANAGARVLRRPWDDDFSAARNASLEAASGAWILVLDADEILAPETGRDLRRAASMRDVSACFLPIVNRYDDSGASVSALILRAWRAGPEVRFRGRIHEQVSWAVLPRAKATRTRLVALGGAVLHDGYRPSVVAARGKNERNLKLFERSLQDAPNDPYVLWKFADFLRRFPERNDDAVALLERGLAIVRGLDDDARKSLPFAGEFFALRAERHRLLGDALTARALAEEGLSLAEATPNLVFAAANAALHLGDGDAAERGFRACLKMGDAPRVVPGQPGVTGARARRGLILALRLRERHADAVAVAEEALAQGATDAETFETWLDSAIRAGKPKEALAFLTERLRRTPDDATTWSIGARLLEGLRLHAESARWRLRAATSRMKGPDPLVAAAADLGAAAACRLFCGDASEALRLAISARADARARAVAAVAYAVAGEPSPAWIDATDPELRASFRALIDGLLRERASTSAIIERLLAAATATDAFDPTTVALLSESALAEASFDAAAR